MATKKITQRKAKEMHRLLNEIYSSLQDKNRNKRFKQIPFIEIAWMLGIENCLRKKSAVKNHSLSIRKVNGSK